MGRCCETSIELEVPFHDVDPMRVVWHGHYYKYLELARTALLRSRGLDLGELIGKRFRMLVIESRCRYAFPPSLWGEGPCHRLGPRHPTSGRDRLRGFEPDPQTAQREGADGPRDRRRRRESPAGDAE